MQVYWVLIYISESDSASTWALWGNRIHCFVVVNFYTFVMSGGLTAFLSAQESWLSASSSSITQEALQ